MEKIIKQKILNFTEKSEIKPTEKFTILHYEYSYIVLRDENNMLVFICDNKCYREKIHIYPIFTLKEIQEILITL